MENDAAAKSHYALAGYEMFSTSRPDRKEGCRTLNWPNTGFRIHQIILYPSPRL